MEASALTQASRSGLLVRRSPLLRLQRDERLVELIRERHDRAFEVLFDRYHGRLLAFCRGILGSAEDAEDVLQDVFVNAHAAMLADSRPLNVRPWLYRIARNRCLNHLRRPAADGQEAMDAHPDANGASTLERVQRREELRAIFTDVAELPETQRTALVLREIDDLSYEEIAAAMGTTLGAVKSLLVRARMALAEASEGRVLDCGEVRLHLAEAAEGLRKIDGPTRYHVRKCQGCRRYRGELRSSSRALAALAPLVPLWALPKALFAKLFGGSGSSGTATGAGTTGAGGGTATGAGAGVSAGGGAGAGVGGAGATAGIGGSAGATAVGGATATAGASGVAGSAAGAGTALGGGVASAGGLGGGLSTAGGVLGAAGAKAATGFATAALLTAGAVGVQHEIATPAAHHSSPPAHTSTAPASAPAYHRAPPSVPPPPPATDPAPSGSTTPATPTPAPSGSTTSTAPTTGTPQPSTTPTAPSPSTTGTPETGTPEPQSAQTLVTGAGNEGGDITAPLDGRGGVGPSTTGTSVPIVISGQIESTAPQPPPAPPPAATPPPIPLPLPPPPPSGDPSGTPPDGSPPPSG
jgi:RNA polymerase sigma factor (sigma-70 family)